LKETMRIFITGASGWIGSAVVAELLAAGHHVLGLARSDASAEKVAAAGAEVRRGDIGDLELLRAAEEGCDGVVHLAFRHDVAFGGDFETAVSSDTTAIALFGDALAGTDKPLAIASDVAGLSPARSPLSGASPSRSPASAAGSSTSARRSRSLSAECVR
jgi:nucleoside-diphosphate-sugar epimerase